MRIPTQQRGAALAIVLILLTLMTLVAGAALRHAAAGLRLTSSIRSADEAFVLAATAVAAGLSLADSNPAMLPGADEITLPTMTTASGSSQSTMHLSGTSACLSPFVGIRYDFEIRATATAGRGARSNQRQSFYICREVCATMPCMESPVTPSSWAVINPAASAP